MDTLTAKRPYLLKAYYDWLLDNYLTPYLVVNADYPGTKVNQDFVENGQIVLNVSPGACGNFDMGMEQISFKARFKGIPQDIIVPMGAVLAIYARENGDGVVFEHEEHYDAQLASTLQVIKGRDQDKSKESDNTNKLSSSKKAPHSHLKVIK